MRGSLFTKHWGDPKSGTWAAIELDHHSHYYLFTADHCPAGIALELDLNLTHVALGLMIHTWGFKLKFLVLEVTVNWGNS